MARRRVAFPAHGSRATTPAARSAPGDSGVKVIRDRRPLASHAVLVPPTPTLHRFADSLRFFKSVVDELMSLVNGFCFFFYLLWLLKCSTTRGHVCLLLALNDCRQ